MFRPTFLGHHQVVWFIPGNYTICDTVISIHYFLLFSRNERCRCVSRVDQNVRRLHSSTSAGRSAGRACQLTKNAVRTRSSSQYLTPRPWFGNDQITTSLSKGTVASFRFILTYVRLSPIVFPLISSVFTSISISHKSFVSFFLSFPPFSSFTCFSSFPFRCVTSTRSFVSFQSQKITCTYHAVSWPSRRSV